MKKLSKVFDEKDSKFAEGMHISEPFSPEPAVYAANGSKSPVELLKPHIPHIRGFKSVRLFPLSKE